MNITTNYGYNCMGYKIIDQLVTICTMGKQLFEEVNHRTKCGFNIIFHLVQVSADGQLMYPRAPNKPIQNDAMYPLVIYQLLDDGEKNKAAC